MQDWLQGLVCVKINAGGDNGHPLAAKFGVEAFPTLVLIEPTGRILHNQPGAPVGESFVDYFAATEYNAAVDAVNIRDPKGAAPHLFFVRKWFPGTKLGKAAEEICRDLDKEEGFKAAYEAAERAHADALAAVRKESEAARQKEQERRAKAKELKAEADELYKKYLRTKAYDVYRRIVAEYGDLPEADEAREILRKNKQKLTK